MEGKMISLVGLGGALGSIARYVLSGWATLGSFPTGTLLVNVLGCFLIGLLLFGGVAGGWMTPQGRAAVGIGFLGGFTTMSSFAYETLAFVESSEWALAFTNIALTLTLCLFATFVGRALGLALWGGK